MSNTSPSHIGSASTSQAHITLYLLWVLANAIGWVTAFLLLGVTWWLIIVVGQGLILVASPIPIFQWLVLRKHVPVKLLPWLIASVLGFLFAFPAMSVARQLVIAALFESIGETGVTILVYIAGPAAAGSVIGLAQWFILRSYLERTSRWIIANMLAIWTGPFSGIITGLFLIRLVQRPLSFQPQPLLLQGIARVKSLVAFLSASVPRTLGLLVVVILIGTWFVATKPCESLDISLGLSGCLAVIEGHQNAIGEVVFSPDGQLLLTGSRDNTAKLWRISDRSLLHTWTFHQPVLSLDFSHDGSLLALSPWGTLQVWHLVEGEPQLQWTRPYFGTGVAFSPDQTLIATGTTNGTQLWQTATGELGQKLGSADISNVVFSPDGTLIAAGIRYSDVSQLWRPSGESEQRFPGGDQGGLAFSPNGAWFATASWPAHSVQVWELFNGTLIHQFDRQIAVVSIAFSPDSQMLAAGSVSGKVWLWNTSDWSLIYSIEAGSPLYDLAFSPDSSVLVTSGDKQVKLWRVPTE